MLRQRLTYVFMTVINIFVFVFTNSRVPLVSAAVLVAAPIVSYAFLRLVAASITVECNIQDSAWDGDVVDIELRLLSRFRLYPGMFSVRRKVHSVMFGEEKETVIEHELGYKSHIINIGFKSRCCGAHDVEIYDVWLYDALQLFSHDKKFALKKNVMIYPRNVNLKALRRSEVTVENEGFMYDKHRSGNDKSEIFELRDYEKGDDIRGIHWKLSAKLNKPIMREFPRPNSSRIMIVCDLSLRYGGKRISNKSVSANIAIATAISINMAKQGMEYSICVISDNVCDIAEVTDYSDGTGIRMRNAIMTIPLSENECNSAFIFSNIRESANVSRLIFVSKAYDMDMLNKMSEFMDITVVTTGDEKSVTYADSKDSGVEIISINSDELYDNTHYIAV